MRMHFKSETFKNETCFNNDSKHKKNTPQRITNCKSAKQPTKTCQWSTMQNPTVRISSRAWGKNWYDTWHSAAGTFRSRGFNVQTCWGMHRQDSATINSTSNPYPSVTAPPIPHMLPDSGQLGHVLVFQILVSHRCDYAQKCPSFLEGEHRPEPFQGPHRNISSLLNYSVFEFPFKPDNCPCPAFTYPQSPQTQFCSPFLYSGRIFKKHRTGLNALCCPHPPALPTLQPSCSHK